MYTAKETYVHGKRDLFILADLGTNSPAASPLDLPPWYA